MRGELHYRPIEVGIVVGVMFASFFIDQQMDEFIEAPPVVPQAIKMGQDNKHREKGRGR